MGGSGLLIYGKRSGSLLNQETLGKGSGILSEYPAEFFFRLADDFRSFLKKAIPKPNTATLYILRYLEMDLPVYLRSQRKKGSS